MSSRNSSSSMSRYRDSGNPDCKIYVGDLASSTSKQDLEDAFAYYGPIRNVWVARNPPGFAFIEFDDARDAEDAVRGADGRRSVNGRRVRVEMCNASRKGFRGPPPRRAGRPFHPEDRCYECGKRGHYARDCRDRGGRGGGGGGGGRARSFSRSRSRSRDRRRSRSPQSRSRSRSRGKRSKSRSRGRSVSRSRSPSRTRTRDTKDRNGDA